MSLQSVIRRWSQLSREEREIVIECMRDNRGPLDTVNVINEMVQQDIDWSIETELERMQENLSTQHGIEAVMYYDLRFSQGDGICFEADSISTVDFLKSINYGNLFDNQDPVYMQVLNDYLHQIDIHTERVNHHYSHENSVVFTTENFNNGIENELINRFAETEDYENDTAEVQQHREWYTKFQELLNEDTLDEALTEWMHDYCVAGYRKLYKIAMPSESTIYELYDNTIETFGESELFQKYSDLSVINNETAATLIKKDEANE